MAFLISFSNSLLILFLLFPISTSIDTITPSQSIKDVDGETLISAAGDYELGFFSPGKSTSRYVGIWYKKAPPEKKYVWVANRDDPLTNLSGVLSITNDGNLAILIAGRPFFQITNTSTAVTAKLLDSGNLVLRDNQNRLLWQSFDYPTHTMLPGMKLGLDRKKGKFRVITSWKSDDDPGTGDYVLRLDLNGSPQFFLWERSEVIWRSGSWNGLGFSGVPLMNHQSVVTYHFTIDDDRIFCSYDLNNKSIFSRLILDSSGYLQRLAWQDGTPSWILFSQVPADQCDAFAKCGTYSSCDVNRVLMCECLQGFKPKVPEAWNLRDWSDGCERRQELSCGEGDGFKKIENVKLPDRRPIRIVRLSSLKECRDLCLKNCSCTAYASADIFKWGGKCLIWDGDLTDLKLYSYGGMDLYVRLAGSELDSSSKKKKPLLMLMLTAIPGMLFLFTCGYCFSKRKSGRKDSSWTKKKLLLIHVLTVIRESLFLFTCGYCFWKRKTERKVAGSLVSFRYIDLRRSTNDFAEKLGGGSFGSVFKGTLPDSAVVAVKKLEGLRQGEKQFRSEVSTIGMIQHVNLVRLRGFCSEGSKRLLVYDFMPNGSLDSHLFGKKSDILDWKTRYQIALGTAKGLAYLHEKCRECIIHCDIKPENILLDAAFCPKVADFGMAKLVGRDFSRVLTTMRGTIGYLAPEWIHGVAITAKADVYSYGMMIFELISGNRNTKQCKISKAGYFPVWAAGKIKEGDVLCLLDQRLEGNADMEELNRACRAACWCIQENEDSRPSMGQVVLILEGILEVNVPPIPRFLQNLVDNEETIISHTESMARLP